MKSQSDSKHRWSVLGIVCIGTFVVVTSPGLVGIALPTIHADLGTDLTLVGWVQIAYQLAITGLLLGFGRLADNVGRKRMYVAGLMIFAIGALLSGLSVNVAQLIASRIVQAMGAAMVIANSRSILTFAFSAQTRGRAMGAMQSASGAGSLLALALGGIIVAWFGWQGVFLVLVPLGVGAGLLTFLLLDEQKAGVQHWEFDWLGAVLLLGILTCLMFVLTQFQTLGWRSLAIQMASSAVVILGGAFYIQQRKNSNPVVDWRLLMQPGFSHANAGSFLSQTSRSMVLFLVPFQFERVFKLSTGQIGLLLLALPMAELLLAPVSGWWADHSSSRQPTAVGMALVSICFLALAYMPTNGSLTTLASWVAIALLGIGFGLFHSANNSAAMGWVPHDQLSMGSSILGTNITLGMGVGVALASTVLASRLDYYLGAGMAGDVAFGTASREVYLATAFISSLALLAAWLAPSERVWVKEIQTHEGAQTP